MMNNVYKETLGTAVNKLETSVNGLTYIFIDTEYCWACSTREGQIPNYKALLDMLNEKYPTNTKIAYLVGYKNKKTGIAEFLVKLGIDYVNLIDNTSCSKTQIVSSTMSVDVARVVYSGKLVKQMVFITGDDYLIPLIPFLFTYNIKIDIYYFPIILSRGLDAMDERYTLNKMTNSYFLYPK